MCLDVLKFFVTKSSIHAVVARPPQNATTGKSILSHCSSFSYPPQVRLDEGGRATVSELVELEEKVAQMEAERLALLSSISDELDEAVQGLLRNGEDNFQVLWDILPFFFPGGCVPSIHPSIHPLA